jgi:hypothetical protein
MKKTMIAIGLVVVAAALYAQTVPADLAGKTFYYKYQFTVNPRTEVRSISNVIILTGLSGDSTYITFTRNACYRSDSNGIQITANDGGGMGTYTYQGEQNNMLVFHVKRADFQGHSYDQYLYFSKDYKRLNYTNEYTSNTNDMVSRIEVYEQSAPPAPQQQTGPAGPDRMW